MQLARVIGTVVATVKNDSLKGRTEFGLSEEEARLIVEDQVRGIVENFDGLCEEIEMTPNTHSQLRRRAVLNPDVFSGCEDLNPKAW